MCHQSVGLVQRAIEAAGISTISMTMMPEITRRVGVPRALRVGFPLGHPFGMPGQGCLQMRLLRLALSNAASIETPGTIVDSGIGDGTGEDCGVCGPVPPALQ
jgi:hypothetical protein